MDTADIQSYGRRLFEAQGAGVSP